MSERTVVKWPECETCTAWTSDCEHTGNWLAKYDNGREGDFPCDHRRAQVLRAKADDMLKSARLSPRFAARTFDTFNVSPDTHEAFHAAMNWCDEDHAEGLGFAMNGPVGTGKTHLAAAILNDWLKRGRLGMFIVLSDFFGELRTAMKKGEESTDEIIDKVATVPLLVLDDMGVDKASAWQASAIYRIVNKRYENFQPIIITTNLSHQEMKELLGYRAHDRLLECCDWYEVRGDSYRRKIAKERKLI